MSDHSHLVQVYEWAAREETVESLSNVAVKSVLRGVWDTKYNRRFVKRIAAVTLDEVLIALLLVFSKFISQTFLLLQGESSGEKVPTAIP